MKIRSLALALFLLSFTGAEAFASPASLTYQGRILKSDGTPLQYNNVSFIFKITDPSGQCIIYQEAVTGVDMTNSSGIFDTAIGSGAINYPKTGNFTILDAFNNNQTFNCGSCSGYTCSDGTSSYTATDGDLRKLRVQFYDGNSWNTIAPDNTIRSVPFAAYALSAQKLGTNIASDFLTKAGLPTCSSGTFLSWNGSTLTCDGISGANGGTVTNVTSSNAYLTITDNTSTPLLTLNVGQTANTVAAGNDSRIVNAMQSGAPAGGDLSGTYPNPSIAELQGKALSISSLTTNQTLLFNGTAWANATLSSANLSDSGSLIKASQLPANCNTGQTLIFSSPTGVWTCSNISLSDSQITYTSQSANRFFASPTSGTGTPSFRAISSSDLPPGTISGTGNTGYLPYFNSGSSLASSPIYYDGSNLGIGTTSPWGNLNVVGSNAVIRATGTTATPGAISASRDYAGSAVTANDLIGGFYFQDTNTADTAFSNNIATITASIDAAGGTTRHKGRISFSTSDGTNITERLRISQNGNVGIGSTTPNVSLDLSSKKDAISLPLGTTSQRPTTLAAGMLRWNSDNTVAEIYNGTDWVNIGTYSGAGSYNNVSTISGSSSGLSISAGGTNQNISLSASGNGVVTTNSVTTITNTTASTSYNNGALVISGGVGVSGNINSNGNIAATGSLSGSALYSPLIYGGTATNSTLTLAGTSNVSPSNAYVVLQPSGGSVGIGTLSPVAKLEVYGSSLIDRGGTGSISNNQGAWTVWNNTAVVGAASQGMTSYVNHRGTGSGGFTFATTNDGATYNELLRIAGTGKVGIGTSNPAAMLEVVDISGASSVATMTSYSNSTGGAGGWTGRHARGTASTPTATLSGDRLNGLWSSGFNGTSWNSNGAAIIMNATENYSSATNNGTNITFENTPNGSGTRVERMRIDSSGNIGIGTASPSYPLQVVGAQNSTGTPFVSSFLDSASLAQDTGGGLGFGGLYNSSGSSATWAGIRGGKENATDGNYAGYLSLYTRPNSSGALERVRISSTGYVGIGTTNPSAMLHVSGSTAQVAVDSNGDASSFTRWDNSASGPAMYISKSRSSIIGTNSVVSNNDALGTLVFRGDNGSGLSWAAEIKASVDSSGTISSSSMPGRLTFYTSANGSTSPTERMRIDSSGNVGIGTTQPAAVLHVRGAPQTSGFPFQAVITDSSAVAQGVGGGIGFRGVNSSANSEAIFGSIQGAKENSIDADYSGYLAFSTRLQGVTSSVTERMRISSTGNVGIGTTNPSYTLHVFRSTATTSALANPTFAIGISSTGTPAAGFGATIPIILDNTANTQIAATDFGGVWVDSTSGSEKGAFIVRTKTGGTMNERFRVDNLGNVGIGTTTPSYPLTVNGDISVNSTSALRFGTTSVCTSIGCTAASDRRLKENIKPLEDSLENVLKLQGVEFDYKDKIQFTDKHQIGVIAQEIEKIYPEAVTTDSETGFKAVAYDHLVAPVIEAVKTIYYRLVSIEKSQNNVKRDIASLTQFTTETSTRIQKLEEENTELKKRNTDLEKRLSRIEKSLGSKN